MSDTLLSSADGSTGDRRDAALIVALVLFALFFRLATLMIMNTGVDERDYWFSAKALASGLPYPDVTHRTTRFAIILPVALTQLILGSHPDVYYVTPVANSMLQAALLYLLGRRLRGRLAGFLAALGLTLFPYMIRAGSQVRPEVFSLTYVLAVLLFFLEYLTRDSREMGPLLWTAGFLFIAYEAKITNMYLAPGMFVAILLYKRKPSHAFLFAGLLAGLFLAETGVYAAVTPYKLGELQIIAVNHFHPDSVTVPSVGSLFQRYASPYLQFYWQLPFVLFGLAAAWYLVTGRDRRLSSLVLLSLSFFLCLTFEVKSLHPVTPAESFINRYFAAVLPPVFLVLACAVQEVVTRIVPRAHRRTAETSLPYIGVLVLGAIAILGVFSLPRLPAGLRAYANSPLKPRQHPLVLNERYRRIINSAYADDTPLVAAEGIAGDNAMETARYFFLDLAFYRNGQPPAIARLESAGTSYLMVAPLHGAPPFDRMLATVRAPFRVLPIRASGLRLLTGDSVDGKTGPVDQDDQ